MPNHVISVVTANLGVIKQLLNDEGKVDFNRVIPQPSNIEKDGCSWSHSKALDSNGDTYHPETGEVCWYDWNIKNWGTKWGAYSQEWYTADGLVPDDAEPDNEPVTVKFETAWSIPVQVFDVLAAENKGVPIHILYADEDIGSNVGIIDYWLDRDVHYQDLHGTDEGRDLACKLHYGKNYAEVKAEWDADDAEDWVDNLIATVRAADDQR